MSKERPLEEARQRIAERKRVESQPKMQLREIKAPAIETYPYEIAAEEDFLHKIPDPLRKLFEDVRKTIEEREKTFLDMTHDCNFSTRDPEKIYSLLKTGRNPIRSADFFFQTTIIEKGEEIGRIVFGPVSPIKEKRPDRTCKIFLKITYHDKHKLVDWIMGDTNGPELKEESENKKKGYRLTAHEGHIKGSIKYSEVNMLTLAEQLVTQIDLGRYKYEVRELPTVQLQ